MNPTAHAQRILEAWRLAGVEPIRTALEDALLFSKINSTTCQQAAEQQSLLEAAAEYILQFVSPLASPQRSNPAAAIGLLQHLAHAPGQQLGLAQAAVTA